MRSDKSKAEHPLERPWSMGSFFIPHWGSSFTLSHLSVKRLTSLSNGNKRRENV